VRRPGLKDNAIFFLWRIAIRMEKTRPIHRFGEARQTASKRTIPRNRETFRWFLVFWFPHKKLFAENCSQNGTRLRNGSHSALGFRASFVIRVSEFGLKHR
jgi:hypothetical protein